MLDINQLWYKPHWIRWFLLPFSWLYYIVASTRKFYLSRFFCKKFNVPIIVVGNITVGGVGKTPFVVTLAKKLEQKGIKVGIVSRGYGATQKIFPYEVQKTDCAYKVGDEPLLLARNTNAPVIIAPKRVDAVNYLLKHHDIQIIISDDGLQHYAMGRDIEIVIIDELRGLGNRLCLPAGPLRELPRRLKTVDFVVVNGKNADFHLCPLEIKQLLTGNTVKPSIFLDTVAAVAGIGNPQRFFDTLQQLNIKFNKYPFMDHHKFTCNDFSFTDDKIIMTEKDALKCISFATENMYFLTVTAKFNDHFWHKLSDAVERVI